MSTSHKISIPLFLLLHSISMSDTPQRLQSRQRRSRCVMLGVSHFAPVCRTLQECVALDRNVSHLRGMCGTYNVPRMSHLVYPDLYAHWNLRACSQDARRLACRSANGKLPTKVCPGIFCMPSSVNSCNRISDGMLAWSATASINGSNKSPVSGLRFASQVQSLGRSLTTSSTA
ncbi:hypothetical protein K438DRAFT_630741 [Mycena galopus ATCC 62051]|nr:hypothetical protein K438DRAFT_630741 [Mycena galopus ATCC 62051]